MTVKKFVTPDNLSEEHFIFNQEKKKIEVNFPKNQSAELSIEVQDAFGEGLGYMSSTQKLGVTKESDLTQV